MHSEHFSEAELQCHCGCGQNECEQEMVDALEDFRAAVGAPVIVTSAYRCKVSNKKAGGAASSQHLTGCAADVKVKGKTARELYAIAQEVPEIHGLGVNDFNNVLHVDVRRAPAKWCYSRGGAWIHWSDTPLNELA